MGKVSMSDFVDLFRIGLKPIPIVWDETNKNAKSHTLAHGELTDDNYNEKTFSDLVKDVSNANGMALKLFSPFGMIDFDLKNTEDKEVFNRWKLAVNSQNEDILSKVCFETTRNGGFHVYIKYPKLKSKLSLAKEVNGEEVIALYTGGVLSYCDPTPGYDMIWNSFEDVDELTDDEYSILISTAETFNKHVELSSFDSDDSHVINGRVAISYPTEYEDVCIQFDRKCTPEVFEHLLNEMTLHEVKDYKYNKKEHFTAYLREGSKANFSAKVYRKINRLLLFTTSLPLYPSFADRTHKDDHNWVLTPSRIIYYKNDRDWSLTIDEIKMICDSADIDLVDSRPVTDIDLIKPDRLKFPIDAFPDPIRDFIEAQRIQHEYLCASALAAISCAVGNKQTLVAGSGYYVKGIIYIAIVAPPGASKTPAMKKIFYPIEKEDSVNYNSYKEKLDQYNKDLSQYKSLKNKENAEEPTRPAMSQILIKDSTIEMLVKILSANELGCCLYADELSGFLKRMSRYGDSDELQKWLELWSGSSIMIQRIGRDEDKVENPYCSIIGGIQPGVLESMSSDENQHNGFYHRFLFCYPNVNDKLNWEQHEVPDHIIDAYNAFLQDLIFRRQMENNYRLSKEANDLYAEWFNNKNKKYNAAVNDDVRGIIAKYQDYCLRFALLIQCCSDAIDSVYGRELITPVSMEKAIRMTEYFLGNMNKSIKVLAPETPIDKLNPIHKKLYDAMPVAFSNKTAMETARKLKIKDVTARSIFKRWSEGKDRILDKIGERSSATYEKVFY